MKLKNAVRKLFTRSLYFLGILQLFLILESRISWRRAVVCLYYHNISSKSSSKPISSLEQGTNSEMFARQIELFSKWLQPIDDLSLCSWLDGDVKLKRDGLLVTFDDGYQDNLTIAGPILAKYQVPGLIFVSTDYVDTGKVFWWTRLSDAIRNIDDLAWKSLAERCLPRPVQDIVAEEDLATWESRLNARRRLGLLIDREVFTGPVLDVIESAACTTGRSSMPILSWDEIKAMKSAGFVFGNHTHTHPRLSKLAETQIAGEIQKCSQSLFDRLGEWPCSIAYPSGDYDQRVRKVARSTGIRLAFTTIPGVIVKTNDRLELPRVGIGSSEAHEICFALVAIRLAKYFPARISRAILKFSS